MKRLAKAAVMLRLREELSNRGSWCGETHLQKATFFLQEATAVPLGFNFILYKYGPFSFDLRDELGALRAEGILELRSNGATLGPKYDATELAKKVSAAYPRTVKTYAPQVEAVAEFIGDQGVGALERLATALMLINEQDGTDEDVAQRLVAIKPHVSFDDAYDATQRVRHFLGSIEVSPARTS